MSESDIPLHILAQREREGRNRQNLAARHIPRLTELVRQYPETQFGSWSRIHELFVEEYPNVQVTADVLKTWYHNIREAQVQDQQKSKPPRKKLSCADRSLDKSAIIPDVGQGRPSRRVKS